MGVHGLTTWVNKQSTLAEYVELGSDDASSSKIAFIIDGFAFIAYLLNADEIDPIRGGSYLSLRRLVRGMMEYYRAVGLEPEIVWDGPYGAAKLPTIINRAQQGIESCASYMQASEPDRHRMHVIANAIRLPLLARAACCHEMASLGIRMHYAEGEADSPTAELAQRRNGWAVSQDSDYFIFPAVSRGYVPFDSIQYGDDRASFFDSTHAKSGGARLRFAVYRPAAVADLLHISLEYLPILAALSGNDQVDYARALQARNPFKRPGSRPFVDHQRIAKAIGYLMHPLDEILDSLLQPSHLRTSQMVDELLCAARSYELQPVDTHCPDFPLHPHSPDSAEQAQCRRLYYQEGFTQGKMGTTILSVIQSGVLVMNVTLERPDYKSPTISLGRPLRMIIYSVLQDTIGMDWNAIKEYGRRNQSLHAAQVPVYSIAELLGLETSPFPTPVLLASAEVRLHFIANALKWDESVPNKSSEYYFYLPLLFSLHHILQRARRPWARSSIFSALATALALSSPDIYDNISASSKLPYVPSTDHIQTTNELVVTLYYFQFLVESLLLVDELTPTHLLFDGSMFHRLLGYGDAVADKMKSELTDEEIGLIKMMVGLVEGPNDL